MKVLNLFFLLLLIPIVSYTQILDGQVTSQTQAWTDALISKKRNPDAVKNEKIIGSQYFKPYFSYGKVLIKNKELEKDFALRYNAYSDEIEVNDGVEIDILVQEPDVSCLIDGERYSYQEYFKKNSGDTQFGYLKTLFGGKQLILYQKETKRYKAAKKARTSLTTSTPPKLVDFEAFYFSNLGETPYRIKLKNKALIALISTSHKLEMKSYLKENSLNVKKKNDLITFFKYYDLLLAQENNLNQ